MIRWEDIDILKVIIINSRNKTDVLNKIGLKNNGGNYNTLSKFIKDNDVDIKHFKINIPNVDEEFITRKRYDGINEILVENSPYKSTTHLKERLYKEGLKERICEMCGQDEEWNGVYISLILDHFNGINDDNRIGNLRIVCPNCNAGLLTHCRGENYLKPKATRKEYERVNKKKCGNKLCDNKIRNRSNYCRSCYNQMRTEKSQVVIEIEDVNNNGINSCNVCDKEIDNEFKHCIDCWSVILKKKQKNKCKGCSKKINRDSTYCKICFGETRRKIDRPTYEQLLKEIEETNYCAVGRKYGVSDNAIRKWIKQY